MALDWNKDISFAGLKKSQPKAKMGYPEKTYMNLVVRDAKESEPRKLLLMGVLLFLVVVFVAKFGVFDFYDRVNQKHGELVKQQQVLSGYQQQLLDYDKVLEEFETYGSAQLSADAGIVSAVEALELVDTVVAPNAEVTSLNLSANTLTLRLSNITLDNVGKLASSLRANPMVQNVSMSTAATEQSAPADVTATMTITLQRA